MPVGSSLVRALLGWICGFLIALAVGANHVRNGSAAHTFLVLALASAALLALMLVFSGWHSLLERRQGEGEGSSEPQDPAKPPAAARPRGSRLRDPARHAQVPASAPAAGPASLFGDDIAPAASQTRIAMLEARLAEEQRELEAAIQAMADADAAASAVGIRPTPAQLELPFDDESSVREEVLETVVALLGSGSRGRPEEIARQLEELLRSAG